MGSNLVALVICMGIAILCVVLLGRTAKPVEKKEQIEKPNITINKDCSLEEMNAYNLNRIANDIHLFAKVLMVFICIFVASLFLAFFYFIGALSILS